VSSTTAVDCVNNNEQDMESVESLEASTVKADLTPQKKPAAWGGCGIAPPSCSLSDVMSETMAQQLELNELQDAQRYT